MVTHATMLRTPRGFTVFAALACLPLLAGVLAPGCGQGDGDRCEIDDDCSGNLVCVLNPGRPDGQCRPPGVTRPVDAATADRVNIDTSLPDRAVDLSPAPDTAPDLAGNRDGNGNGDTSGDGPIDSAGTAATPDAGAADASTVDRPNG